MNRARPPRHSYTPAAPGDGDAVASPYRTVQSKPISTTQLKSCALKSCERGLCTPTDPKVSANGTQPAPAQLNCNGTLDRPWHGLCRGSLKVDFSKQRVRGAFRRDLRAGSGGIRRLKGANCQMVFGGAVIILKISFSSKGFLIIVDAGSRLFTPGDEEFA